MVLRRPIETTRTTGEAKLRFGASPVGAFIEPYSVNESASR
jgi:hypothetical protein